MFSNDRIAMRQIYYQAWKKHHDKVPLLALEQQIVAVIIDHPEYQSALTQLDQFVDKDYLPELGEVNPFLHLSLHLGLREQAATNRPAGIQAIFATLAQQVGDHEAEHQMMNCLAELLWQAQQQGSFPDENYYVDKLKRLLAP
ncbi:MAG: DUF1841 family protein [Gammaproteobacteria bacterium]|nr:DUF1841 family protein [Gammaproteobacteria bacterium]